MLVDVASWIGAIAVLGTYAMSTERPEWFDWANALCFIPVMAPAVLRGAYAPATISLVFGLVAIYNLWKRRRSSAKA